MEIFKVWNATHADFKTIWLNNKNCFEIIQHEETRIQFNISEMNPSNHFGTWILFEKAIYYESYECIDKPDNTYYVLNNTRNTGVIKNCSEACKTCLGEGNSIDTNCIKCAEDYFKAEDSDTHCQLKESISLDDYYFNTSDNIYYHCYHNCKGCDGSYNPNTTDMFCLNCIDDYYFIYGENNCYNFTVLQGNKYYFNNNDKKFHKCYHTCSKCSNFEPNETNHSCIKCISGYYFLENTNNCYDMNFTENRYYLDNTNITIEKPLFKKCYNSCKTCEWGLNSTIKGDNHNCRECEDNYYKFEKDLFPNICYDNETIKLLYENYKKRIYDPNITSNEFKNQIRDDITSFVNSSKVINGSNFLAVILSSEDINSEEQLKNGISSFDLGNCTNVIKEYYNIS